MFLEIKGIKKSFGAGESRVDVLKGIDLEIEKGEFCVLLGPSGSGKSTLLNIIGGIDRADSGQIIIEDELMEKMNTKRLSQYRRKHLGYVFQMYNVHQDATFLPMDLICDKAKVRGGREVPMVSASASKDKNGRIHISLANVDVDNAQSITLDLQGQKIGSVKGRILTSASINDHNTFEKPDVVKPATFDGAKIEKGQLKIDLPAKSIVVLEVK